MRVLSSIALGALLVSLPGNAEVKPVGTVLSSQCHFSATVGIYTSVCVTSLRATDPNYFMLTDEDGASDYLALTRTTNAPVVQGCVQFDAAGITYDENGYSIHTTGMVRHCDRSHMPGSLKPMVIFDLKQGATVLKGSYELEPVAHTESVGS